MDTKQLSTLSKFDKYFQEKTNERISKGDLNDYGINSQLNDEFREYLKSMDKEELVNNYFNLIISSILLTKDNKQHLQSLKVEFKIEDDLREEVKRKQRVTNSVYSKIKDNALKFLLNSNISKEDKELFKDTFSDFL